MINYLTWDSDFFGFPIGKITVKKLHADNIIPLLTHAEHERFRCLYFEANPDDAITIAIAESHGFHLVDVRTVLEHPFDDRPAPVPLYPIPDNLMITSPHPNDMSRLKEISAQTGYTSRFAFDKNFGKIASERLYQAWIENATKGYADKIFIARCGKDGEAIGLMTCTLQSDIANIQLAGVSLDYRKRSVGTALVQTALDWAKSEKCAKMHVVTQGRNVPAQRLYQQMGFFTKSVSLFYHKWL